jgi:uncharacterized protein YdiU (UPF0061 family)
MAMTHPEGAPLFAFEHTYVRDLEGLFTPWQAATAPAPRLLELNTTLAVELGIDPDALRTPAGVATLVGNSTEPGSTPVAQAYSGHQFGGYSPRLGDGRALLLGEVLDARGERRDVHLKGSGRTPFARGGDGKAAVGPMLREFVISEAMHAMGVPTTRSLAVTATGEMIVRDTAVPGAVLTRVAASHVRVGTFQYAAALDDPTVLPRLADYAIARHHPAAAQSDAPYLGLLQAVIDVQAALIARWMLVGFVHGVMNTDNMTVSGETIDYGPCAFMDAYDPSTVFSSIDQHGRYAFGNQPDIAMWNLARFAETLLPLIATDPHDAVGPAMELLGTFDTRYRQHWNEGMRAKLGLPDGLVDEAAAGDESLVTDLLHLLQEQRIDYTMFLRSLSSAVRGDAAASRSLLAQPEMFDTWCERWLVRVLAEGRDPHAVAAAMDAVNPVYIARNHQVEAALAAATAGDLGPFDRLVDVVTQPFTERPGLADYAAPAPASFGNYRTFCGT